MGDGSKIIISSGAAASGTFAGNGTRIIVDSGGTLVAGAILGGSEDVSGLDQGSDIGNGGVFTLYAGGSALDTVFTLSGNGYVMSGGLASGTVVSFGGTETILNSGTAAATVVSAFGSAVISGGGTAAGMTVAAGGMGFGFADSVLSDVSVEQGGLLIVEEARSLTGTVAPGGYVFATETDTRGVAGTVISTGVTVLSAAAGGWTATQSGTSATGLLISSTSETALALAGGTIAGGVLTAGATAAIYGGGLIQGTTVTADGVAELNSGGRSEATVIGQAGTEIVSSGAVASGSTVLSGGSLLVEAGGTATGSLLSGAVLIVEGAERSGTITDHAFEFISGGDAAHDRITNGAEQIVSGGKTDGSLLGFGGTELVSAGGIASATFVSGGGALFIVRSGSAEATSAAGGLVAVGSGGKADGLSLRDDGWAVIDSGAAVSDLAVARGGLALIIGDAVVSGDVASGGAVIEAQGASATLTGSGTVLATGGAILSAAADGGLAVVATSLPVGGSVTAGEQAMVLASGRLDGSATSGAVVRVYADGLTSGLAVDDAVEAVSSGGAAAGGAITDAGALYVFSGATATSMTVATEGLMTVDGGGYARHVLVASGGVLVADADITTSGGSALPGLLSDVTVAGGGVLDVDFGGAAAAVTLEDAGAAYVFGSLSEAMLGSGSYAVIESAYGALASYTHPGIMTGSVIEGTVLVEGGSAGVAASLASDTVATGGVVLAESGAVIDSSVIVSSGGTMILLSSSISAPLPTVSSGGVLITDSAVIVSQPGTITSYLGSVSGLPVNSGSSAYVLQGATTTAATIERDGVLAVQSGGSAVESVIAAGGTLFADAGAVLQGITFAGIEGNLEFTAAPTSAILVSDFAATDHLFFDTISGGGAQYSLEGGNTLVISGYVAGDDVEQTTTVILDASSSYTSAFVLSNTKTGGLEVSYEPATSSSYPDTDNTTSYSMPLYVLDFGGQYKIGIELSLDGGATYKMYEFDTGGTGLYAAYNTNWWSAYTAVSSNPSVFYYTSGNTYTAQVVSTTVTFQTSSGPVGVSTDVGLIQSADDPAKFTPQSWNDDTTSLIASPPLQDYFYGDFGVGLGSAENGVDNILAQFPSGASDGFAVTVGNAPDSGAGGVGSLQVGLTAEDISSYTTVIAMQGADGLATFAGSGETSYQELLAEGMLIISAYLSGTLEVPTGFVFDTGAPSTEVHTGSVINSSVISSLSSSTGLVLSAASVTVGGTVTSGWVLENSDDYSVGSSSAIGDAAGYVNTGLNAFWGVSVMFDLADGVIGFKTIACFAEGTLIRTPEGERAVETLAPGDHVTVLDGRAAAVQWVGYRSLDCLRHPDPATVLPVRIAAHAFGPGLPARDLYLSPDHALYYDGVLIPVKHLVNGGSVAQVSLPHVTYYHVELAAHDVIFAEGLPAETYLETGQRAAFANGGDAMMLHPRFAPPDADAQLLWAALGYAPLAVSGPQLERARRQLDRAAQSVKAHEPLHGTG